MSQQVAVTPEDEARAAMVVAELVGAVPKDRIARIGLLIATVRREQQQRDMALALSEQVDADSTQTEGDIAYNCACEHIAQAIEGGGR